VCVVRLTHWSLFLQGSVSGKSVPALANQAVHHGSVWRVPRFSLTKAMVGVRAFGTLQKLGASQNRSARCGVELRPSNPQPVTVSTVICRVGTSSGHTKASGVNLASRCALACKGTERRAIRKVLGPSMDTGSDVRTQIFHGFTLSFLANALD
jgi:hypothetical protein